MGSMSLKMLEKSLNVLFKKGYESWILHPGDTNNTPAMMDKNVKKNVRFYVYFKKNSSWKHWELQILLLNDIVEVHWIISTLDWMTKVVWEEGLLRYKNPWDGWENAKFLKTCLRLWVLHAAETVINCGLLGLIRLVGPLLLGLMSRSKINNKLLFYP